MKEFKLTGRLLENRIIPGNGYSNILEDIQLFTKSSTPRVELIIRVEDPRQDWIDKWYTKAIRGDDFLAFRKDVVIAYNDFGEIATAAPVRGDKYDRHTGIAVAYAKLNGEPIPDYI